MKEIIILIVVLMTVINLSLAFHAMALFSEILKLKWLQKLFVAYFGG